MNIFSTIICSTVPETERMDFVDKLFGISYVLKLEPTVFNMAGMLAAEYSGAYWEFFTLSNGGFFMAPRGEDTIFDVSCQNGFDGKLSANALGLASSLYAYSHLSFGGDAFSELAATHFHWCRAWACEHPESSSLLACID